MVGMAGYGRYNADKSPVNKSDMAHLGRTGEYVSLLGVQCYVASRQMSRRLPQANCTTHRTFREVLPIPLSSWYQRS